MKLYHTAPFMSIPEACKAAPLCRVGKIMPLRRSAWDRVFTVLRRNKRRDNEHEKPKCADSHGKDFPQGRFSFVKKSESR